MQSATSARAVIVTVSVLPLHLEMIYFTSSGSVANEVALRLATAATDGGTDSLVQPGWVSRTFSS